MDKLKRVLSGNDSPSEENRGIMGDVCIRHIQIKRCTINKKEYATKHSRWRNSDS